MPGVRQVSWVNLAKLRYQTCLPHAEALEPWSCTTLASQTKQIIPVNSSGDALRPTLRDTWVGDMTLVNYFKPFCCFPVWSLASHLLLSLLISSTVWLWEHLVLPSAACDSSFDRSCNLQFPILEANATYLHGKGWKGPVLITKMLCTNVSEAIWD